MAGPNVTLIDPTAVDLDPLYLTPNAASFYAQVNQQTFQRAGLMHYNGWQYTAWYTGTGQAMVARRHVGTVEWETLGLDHYFTGVDSHRVISLGVSPVDGRIHLAMDCHTSVAYYTRTATGVAGTGADWASAWEPVAQLLPGGVDPGPITYPQFIPTPEGLLQMLYRVGIPENGQLNLAEWDGTAWTLLGAFTSSTGSYPVTGWGTSTGRNLYPDGCLYDATGRLHLFGTWREQPQVTAQASGSLTGGIPNRDDVYLYSDDRGRTWKTNAGQVAVTGSATLASMNSPGITAYPQLPHFARQNMETMAVDSSGRVHVIETYVPGRFTNSAHGMPLGVVNDAVNQRPVYARAIHMYQDPTSPTGWTRKEIKVGSADCPVNSFGRCQLVMLTSDDMVVVYPKLKIVTASAASGWTDWTIQPTPLTNAFGECLVDLNGSVLSVAYQETNGGALCVREFEVG